MSPLGRVAVIGGGSWATALAKLLLNNNDRITWYLRNSDRITEFRKFGRNPVYLTDVPFETSRIDFTSEINEAAENADTLVLAVPSPYLKSELDKLTACISGKNIVSAVKGIVPDQNMIVSDYVASRFGVLPSNTLVIGGPCHAEEVALDHLSYLTIGCSDTMKSVEFSRLIAGPQMKPVISNDVAGIEYAAVLKNVYAIAAGMVKGMRAGDNFLAMLVCNSTREMRTFIDTVAPMERDVCLSAYLGDLLVTAYSRFSRNHNFGSMIGKGYSVKVAKMEMSMVAEGYYGTKCVHEVNAALPVPVQMPILDCVYSVLYGAKPVRTAFKHLAGCLS